MTKEQWFDIFKTGLVIVYGVLGLLAAFGPLAQYREWLLLVAGIVSVVAGVVGVQLTRITQQARNVSATRKAKKAA